MAMAGNIAYLPKQAVPGGMQGQPIHFPITSPWAQQIQALAAQVGGGQAQSNPLQNFVPPAPNLPAGTYTGPYAAQGLRTTDPTAAAQLWESRHPGAVHAGNIPNWVMQAQTQQLQNGMGVHHSNPLELVHPGGHMNPHQVLQDVVNHHRQSNGLAAMHPEELHARVTNLAHEILNSRGNRLRRTLRSIVPPTPMPPSGPAGGPFVAS